MKTVSHYFFTKETELGVNCWDQHFLFFENLCQSNKYKYNKSSYKTYGTA